jgi:hypothetical protein
MALSVADAVGTSLVSVNALNQDPTQFAVLWVDITQGPILTHPIKASFIPENSYYQRWFALFRTLPELHEAVQIWHTSNDPNVKSMKDFQIHQTSFHPSINQPVLQPKPLSVTETYPNHLSF